MRVAPSNSDPSSAELACPQQTLQPRRSGFASRAKPSKPPPPSCTAVFATTAPHHRAARRPQFCDARLQEGAPRRRQGEEGAAGRREAQARQEARALRRGRAGARPRRARGGRPHGRAARGQPALPGRLHFVHPRDRRRARPAVEPPQLRRHDRRQPRRRLPGRRLHGERLRGPAAQGAVAGAEQPDVAAAAAGRHAPLLPQVLLQGRHHRGRHRRVQEWGGEGRPKILCDGGERRGQRTRVHSFRAVVPRRRALPPPQRDLRGRRRQPERRDLGAVDVDDGARPRRRAHISRRRRGHLHRPAVVAGRLPDVVRRRLPRVVRRGQRQRGRRGQRGERGAARRRLPRIRLRSPRVGAAVAARPRVPRPSRVDRQPLPLRGRVVRRAAAPPARPPAAALPASPRPPAAARAAPCSSAGRT